MRTTEKREPPEKQQERVNNLKAATVAQDLYDETIRLLCKEELFPKKTRWLMGEDIARIANRFLQMVLYANGIKVDNQELAVKRHNAQREAVALIKALNGSIEGARRHYGFSADRLKNWMHIYNNEKQLLSGWISSDSKKYKLNSTEIDKA